jgi:hypothetical protein
MGLAGSCRTPCRFFQLAGLFALALLVVFYVLAFIYGHRRDVLLEKKIITIEAQQYPRELPANQREQIISKLKAFAGNRISILGVGGPEAGGFGDQIVATVVQAGWHLNALSLYRVADTPRKGLVFAVPDPRSMTPAEIALVTAFNGVGIKVTLDIGEDVLYVGIRVPESFEAA